MKTMISTAAFLAMTTGAAAQIPSIPSPLVDRARLNESKGLLDELTAAYNRGDWKHLQKKGADVLKKVCVAQRPIDAGRDYVLLVWPGEDQAGESALRWAVIHEPAPDEYVAALPGLKHAGRRKLYEVYLGADTRARFGSYYLSTRVDDPLPSQLPAFVQAVSTPLTALAAGTTPPPFKPAAVAPGMVMGLSPDPCAPQPVEDPLYVTVRRVDLPMRRADVSAALASFEPKVFAEAAADLAQSLSRGEVSHDLCARNLSTEMAKTAIEISRGSACAAPPADATPEERKAAAEECATAYDAKLSETYSTAIAACPATRDVDAAVHVNREFRKFVSTPAGDKLKAEAVLKNRPYAHLNLGALSSFILSGGTTKPRAVVADGKVVEDPLPRPLTAAVVNWSIQGVDTQRRSPRFPERFHLFGGATLTPDFGLTAGLNFTIYRGLGVNAGRAWLFHKTAPADALDKAPSSSDPLSVATAGVWFAGFSYSFGQ